MKTVRGTVHSSRPISLSKATSTFASFISSDTGASHVCDFYLRRSLASFRELKQLHRELNAPRPHRRQSRHWSVSQNDVAEAVGENPSRSVVLTEEVSLGLESKPNPKGNEKKGGVRNFCEDGGGIGGRGEEEIDDKKTKRAKRGSAGNSGDNGGRIEKGDGEKREAAESVEMNSKKKKKKKKKKTKENVGNSDENGGHIEKGKAVDSPELHSKKKKDNAGNSNENEVKIEKGDGEAKIGNGEVKKEEMKKRKSGVLEDGGTEEQVDKKKKRRKS